MDITDEIKTRLSILDVTGEYLELRKAGRNFKALCPFHHEKTPSFTINPELGVYKCFGCGASGDIFTFLMEREHLTFPEALERLAGKAGVILPQRIPKRQLDKKNQAFQLNKHAALFFQQLLFGEEGKEAFAYLFERGLTTETIEQFQLGFVPLAWDSLSKTIPDADRALAVEIGLLMQKDRGAASSPHYYDRFRGRIMFPIKDHNGGIIGFSGRLLDSLYSPDTLQHAGGKYINSPQSLLFHKSATLYGFDQARESIVSKKHVVIVEGNLDVLHLHQIGVSQTIAPLGTALTLHHLNVLKRFASEVILALDGDTAGLAATIKTLPLTGQLNCATAVIPLPAGYDVAQWLTAGNSWDELASKKTDGILFALQTLRQQHDPNTAKGREVIVSQLLDMLSHFTSSIMIDFYLSTIAHEVGITEQALRREFTHRIKAKKTSAPANVRTPAEPAHSTSLAAATSLPSPGTSLAARTEQYLIKLMSEHLELLPTILPELDAALFRDPASQAFIHVLQRIPHAMTIKVYLEALPTEWQTVWQALLLDDQTFPTEGIDNPLQTMRELGKQLSRVHFEGMLKQLQRTLLTTKDAEEKKKLLRQLHYYRMKKESLSLTDPHKVSQMQKNLLYWEENFTG